MSSGSQVQQEKLSREYSKLATAHETLKRENELLLLQLHQVQEELESTFFQKQKLEQEQAEQASTHQRLETKVAQLNEACDQQTKLNTACQAKLEDVSQNYRALEAVKLTVEEENALLLQELHRLQEEFEDTIRYNKNLKRKQQQLENAREKADQERGALTQELLRERERLNTKELEIRRERQRTIKLKMDFAQEIEGERRRALKLKADLVQEIERERRRTIQLKQTLSWRITAPIRALSIPFRPSTQECDEIEETQSDETKKTGPDETKETEGGAIEEEIALIRSSGYFDEAYYLEINTDVAKEGKDPVEHYVRYGALEGRNPSEMFNTRRYLEINPDVAELGINPLVHFIKYGMAEGRVVF